MTPETTIRKQLGRYRVNFHDLCTPITITLWRNLSTDRVQAEYSCLLKTPLQAQPYGPGDITAFNAGEDTDTLACKLANRMDGYCHEAVAAGYEPS